MPENGSVAFLGLGHMGGPMALNLVRAGYRVTGFDVVPAAMEAARVQGVPVAATAVEALAGADVVLTMFPSGRHVLDAYRGNPGHPGQPGEPGLLAAAPPGTMFLDCSTINVDEAREAARLAIEAGHRSVDAPVSGGVVGAEAGTLTFMAGGDAAGFEEVLPLLEVMGRRVVHCGAHGAGQAAKICNNMILGVSMIAVSEAFVLGEKLGLTHQALFDVASASSGQCWSLTSYCPVPGPVPASPANSDYKPGFAAALMLKDLKLAREAAGAVHVKTAIGTHAAEIYERFAQAGHSGTDFSGIINFVREVSKQG